MVIMVRKIHFRRPLVKSASAKKSAIKSCSTAIYPNPAGLKMRSAVARTVFGLVAGCCLSMASAVSAEVNVTGNEQRMVGFPADFGSLGDEDSDAHITCWQQGQKVFSDKDYNTVLLGTLAGESSITLKNNKDGAQVLAVSLDQSLCLVTITP